MTTTQLRLLSILGSELVTDAVEQLDVALLWILLHGVDEGPGHGTSSLCGNGSVGSVSNTVSKDSLRLRDTDGMGMVLKMVLKTGKKPPIQLVRQAGHPT